MQPYQTKLKKVKAVQITADMVIDKSLPAGVVVKAASYMDYPRQLFSCVLVYQRGMELVPVDIGDYLVISETGYAMIYTEKGFTDHFEPVPGRGDYKNPVCKGSMLLGTACGQCERCEEEMYGKQG